MSALDSGPGRWSPAAAGDPPPARPAARLDRLHAGDGLTVRVAGETDLPVIEAAIRRWSEAGVLLPLAGPALRSALPDFRIMTAAGDGRVILAFGALRRYPAGLGEIRSLVVADGQRGRGLGRLLIAHLLEEAGDEGIGRVFVLTRTPRLFERLGFALVPRESLPEKVFADCARCARRERCDEYALVREERR
jgi:amino-acid N-acetyltransferase